MRKPLGRLWRALPIRDGGAAPHCGTCLAPRAGAAPAPADTQKH